MGQLYYWIGAIVFWFVSTITSILIVTVAIKWTMNMLWERAGKPLYFVYWYFASKNARNNPREAAKMYRQYADQLEALAPSKRA